MVVFFFLLSLLCYKGRFWKVPSLWDGRLILARWVAQRSCPTVGLRTWSTAEQPLQKNVRTSLHSPYTLEYSEAGISLLAAIAWETVLRFLIACTCNGSQALKNHVHKIREEKWSMQVVPTYCSSGTKRDNLCWAMLQWAVTFLLWVYYFKCIIFRAFKSIKAHGCWIRASSDCTSKSGGHKELFRVVQWMTCRSNELLVYFGPAVLFCAAGQPAHERCLCAVYCWT